MKRACIFILLSLAMALAGCGRGADAISADFARLRESADSWAIWEYCCIVGKNGDVTVWTLFDGNKSYSRCDMAHKHGIQQIWKIDGALYSAEGIIAEGDKSEPPTDCWQSADVFALKERVMAALSADTADYRFFNAPPEGDYTVFIEDESSDKDESSDITYTISVSGGNQGVTDILINYDNGDDRWAEIIKPSDKDTPWQEYIDWEGGGNG